MLVTVSLFSLPDTGSSVDFAVEFADGTKTAEIMKVVARVT